VTDQADELSHITSTMIGYRIGPPETLEVYQQKLGRSRPRPRPDYTVLWTGLEADLERWVMSGGFDKPRLPDEILGQFWDMMQKRKERA